MIGLQAVSQEGIHTLTMEVKGLKSTEGKLRLRLLNTDEKVVMRQMVEVTGTEMTAYFENVSSGTYAVTYYHDENDNGQLDFKWYGAPDEGTGNSNDVKGIFGPPDFEKQLIEISGPLTVSMTTFHF